MYRISAPVQWASICQSPSAIRFGLKMILIRGALTTMGNMRPPARTARPIKADLQRDRTCTAAARCLLPLANDRKAELRRREESR